MSFGQKLCGINQLFLSTCKTFPVLCGNHYVHVVSSMESLLLLLVCYYRRETDHQFVIIEGNIPSASICRFLAAPCNAKTLARHKQEMIRLHCL